MKNCLSVVRMDKVNVFWVYGYTLGILKSTFEEKAAEWIHFLTSNQNFYF